VSQSTRCGRSVACGASPFERGVLQREDSVRVHLDALYHEGLAKLASPVVVRDCGTGLFTSTPRIGTASPTIGRVDAETRASTATTIPVVEPRSDEHVCGSLPSSTAPASARPVASPSRSQPKWLRRFAATPRAQAALRCRTSRVRQAAKDWRQSLALGVFQPIGVETESRGRDVAASF